MAKRYYEAPEEYAPTRPGHLGGFPAVFLAGGITDCPDWQHEAALRLVDHYVVLNPRRRDFPIGDPTAAEGQIRWEYEHLRRADLILFWFPASPSPQPIALYELGAHAVSDVPLVVGTDPGYSRRTDVAVQLGLVRPLLTVWDNLASVCSDAISRRRYG